MGPAYQPEVGPGRVGHTAARAARDCVDDRGDGDEAEDDGDGGHRDLEHARAVADPAAAAVSRGCCRRCDVERHRRGRTQQLLALLQATHACCHTERRAARARRASVVRLLVLCSLHLSAPGEGAVTDSSARFTPPAHQPRD